MGLVTATCIFAFFCAVIAHNTDHLQILKKVDEPDFPDDPGAGHMAEATLEVIERNIEMFNEPNIISTHRTNYVSHNLELIELRYRELENLLKALQDKGAYFLISCEVADLYRQGWSIRKYKEKIILRKWSEDADTIQCEKSISDIRDACNGKVYPVDANTLDNLPLGTYILH